jgi:MOSC domain-containing protein YiiM
VDPVQPDSMPLVPAQLVPAQLVSVQAGRVRQLGDAAAADRMDRPWSTGIFKTPVTGRARVTALGLDGDEQANTVDHGGPDKALLAYSVENLAAWADVLGDVPPGGFGENLTLRGLDETTVCIGDELRIGGTILQCSQPRQPCWKLDRRWRRRDLSAQVIENGRSGWYLRVVEPGELGAGDTVELLGRPNPDWPVARAARIMHRVDRDPRAAADLAALPQLSSSWRDTLLARSR